ncbi:hypothetical protein VB636_10055 [Paracoccus sp. APAP_BH8]|uniref:hypothetical protein n=1 Tax=Paracoccus sp. APAP_BH8 TaxID=3110237 RepID=UPI002FD811B6
MSAALAPFASWPIITGRVYNAEQVPPYGLPGNATQSGWNLRPAWASWMAMGMSDQARTPFSTRSMAASVAAAGLAILLALAALRLADRRLAAAPAARGLERALEGSSGVEPRDFTPNFPVRLRALYAQ